MAFSCLATRSSLSRHHLPQNTARLCSRASAASRHLLLAALFLFITTLIISYATPRKRAYYAFLLLPRRLPSIVSFYANLLVTFLLLLCHFSRLITAILDEGVTVWRGAYGRTSLLWWRGRPHDGVGGRSGDDGKRNGGVGWQI